MAMLDEKTVIKRLEEDKNYPILFKKTITYKNLTKAIADFERTLVKP